MIFNILIIAFVTCSAVASSASRRNLKTIQSIYNHTVFPNNIPILESDGKALPPGLFSQFSTGRVSPLGNFSGFTDSVEYFFALAPVPSASSFFQGISKAEVVEFTSGCAEVAASTVHLTVSVINPNSTNNGQIVGTIKQTAFWRFDNQGAVLFYDATIPNLDGVTRLIQHVPDFSAPAVQATVINITCQAAQALCIGNNTQYDSFEQCNLTLTQRNFGSWDEVWGDNVVCRQVHSFLAVANPTVHCPHVGPTGGGKCVNVHYETVYIDDDVALFNGPLGSVFACPEHY